MMKRIEDSSAKNNFVIKEEDTITNAQPKIQRNSHYKRLKRNGQAKSFKPRSSSYSLVQMVNRI